MKFFAVVNSVFAALILTLCFANCSTANVDSTPTGALKNYLAAANKKDAAAMKALLSDGTLKITEEAARAQNKSVDEILKTDAERSLASKTGDAETRNEQITGDAATLEVKNPQTGGWDKLYFAKENGVWKIALDKMMQEMLKDAGEAGQN